MVDLYEHQRTVLQKMHNGCVLWGDVGGGKSIVSVAYFIEKVCGGTKPDSRELRTPKDIYVITTAKKRDSLDWLEEAQKYAIGANREESISGVQLTVDSWNNIGKYVGVKDAFFVFDEQRTVGSGTWATKFIKIARANEWILLSATPGDTWLDYATLFIANGWYKNRTSFKQRHVEYAPYVKFPKVLRYRETGRLVKLRNYMLVEMPFQRHTERHHETIVVDYDKDLLMKVVKERWHVYEERPLKDVAELWAVARRVVRTDASRIGAVRTLMSRHPRLIVFYNTNAELEMLRGLASQPAQPESASYTVPTSTGSTRTLKTTSKTSASIPSCGEELSSTRTRSKSLSSEKQLGPTPTSTSDSRISSTVSGPTSTSTPGLSSRMNQVRGLEHLSERLQTPVCQGVETGYRNGSLSSTSDTHFGQLSTSSTSPSEELTSKERPTSISTSTSSSCNTALSEDSTSASRPTSSTSTEEMTTPKHPGSLSPSTRSTSSTEPSSVSSEPSTDPSRSGKLLSSRSDTPSGQGLATGSAGAKRKTVHSSLDEPENASAGPVSQFAVAEWNGHKHEPIPDTDRWVYLVQYVAGSEGWNCTSTDAMVFFSLCASYKNWHQAHGRIDRLNTPFRDLYYHKLVSDSFIDHLNWASLVDKKDFNERDVNPSLMVLE